MIHKWVSLEKRWAIDKNFKSPMTYERTKELVNNLHTIQTQNTVSAQWRTPVEGHGIILGSHGSIFVHKLTEYELDHLNMFFN